MRPRYYLPKQEFRTRGEIMESSAASFVVKIGGRLLRGTLLYLGRRGEGSLEGERSSGFSLVSFREKKRQGEKKFFFLSFLYSAIVFFRLDFAKNKMLFIWIIKGNCTKVKNIGEFFLFRRRINEEVYFFWIIFLIGALKKKDFLWNFYLSYCLLIANEIFINIQLSEL